MRDLFAGFIREDKGSSTIEAILWLPVFFGFFALVADASFLFFGQNKAYRIIQEANRTLSTGYLDNEFEVEAYVLDQLSDYAPHATVHSEIDLGKVTTQVRIPSSDLTATGIFASLVDVDITAQATHFIEY